MPDAATSRVVRRVARARQWLAGLAVLASVGTPLAALAANEADVIGQAYDLKSGDLLYSEHYFCSEDDLACSVLYRDSDGDLIARKEIDYTVSPRSPALYLQDYRQASELRLEQSADPDLVVDAGFDNYVRQRWDELDQGGRIRFPFLVIGRERPLEMEASKVDASECTEEELCLQIRLDSWLLGMLVDPIELAYDRSSRRLLRFRGISNLRDIDGGSQYVDIRYSYREG